LAKKKAAGPAPADPQTEYDLGDLAARSEQCERLREKREALKAEIDEATRKLKNLRRKYQEAGWDYQSALARFHEATMHLRRSQGMLTKAEAGENGRADP